ncbi:MAG: polysaccharide pyruvyl transferase family protein [Planctomycetota bacterium]
MNLNQLIEAYKGKTVHVLICPGNAGDGLIHAAGRQLFKSHDIKIREFVYPVEAGGETLFIYGNGNFGCAYGVRVSHCLHYYDKYKKVIILPSTFDPDFEAGINLLANLPPHVIVFCREKTSYKTALACTNATESIHLDHDLAFSFDFRPWRQRKGSGILSCFRTDSESALGKPTIPSIDVSRYGGRNDAWPLLYTISHFREVHTDRTHVGIAAAMLGKKTFLYDNSYHKNRSIYEHSMQELENVTYMGQQPPEISIPTANRLRMKAIHIAMRTRKPLTRLFCRSRKNQRKKTPA